MIVLQKCHSTWHLHLVLLVLAAMSSSSNVWSFAPIHSAVSRSANCVKDPKVCLFANDKNDPNNNSNGDCSNEEDQDKMVSEFFFNVSKNNMDNRISMDAGIHEMVEGSSNGHNTLINSSSKSFVGMTDFATAQAEEPSSSTVIVMDWECLLDALPYHVELGIHAARTVWPHLNDLCNFDTDRQWLENKLFAMSHVLGSPEGPDQTRHVAVEYALATRLILEEQALDRNESTGKNGKYSRKFHPRSEINGSEKFNANSRSRRPLTAGELAVNWREFIRSTLIVKYSRGRDGNPTKMEPTNELEQAIEHYLSSSGTTSKNEPSNRRTGRLALFPKTKFALHNSAAKIIVRISHRFDNNIVAKSLNQQLQLLPKERIAKTYKAENAIRRLFLNEDKNMVLLLRPDHAYGQFNDGKPVEISEPNAEQNCLESIIRYTHECDNKHKHPSPSDDDDESSSLTTTSVPSVVWVDSSWHRLQKLAPIFGDTIPGKDPARKNAGQCEVREGGASVWLSLYLAEWPATDTSLETTTLVTAENQEAAMVYPWTDSLSWDDAEDIIIPSSWGSSDTAFQ